MKIKQSKITASSRKLKAKWSVFNPEDEINIVYSYNQENEIFTVEFTFCKDSKKQKSTLERKTEFPNEGWIIIRYIDKFNLKDISKEDARRLWETLQESYYFELVEHKELGDYFGLTTDIDDVVNELAEQIKEKMDEQIVQELISAAQDEKKINNIYEK
jgi:hypothetical protein